MHQALASVPGLLIGELPTTSPAFAFIDCEGANRNSGPCVKPYRRHCCFRHRSERAAFARGGRAVGGEGGGGFLSTNLTSASFAPAALRQPCLGVR